MRWNRKQNFGPDTTGLDLWTMTRRGHFITANSTFSWRVAWPGESPGHRSSRPFAGINTIRMGPGHGTPIHDALESRRIERSPNHGIR
jgi:hypothetical protein